MGRFCLGDIEAGAGWILSNGAGLSGRDRGSRRVETEEWLPGRDGGAGGGWKLRNGVVLSGRRVETKEWGGVSERDKGRRRVEIIEMSGDEDRARNR